jgi:hypothetical protein
MKTKLVFMVLAWIVLALPAQATYAGDAPFPTIVDTLTGSPPEGFAIGKGSTAYNSSPLGSIYKVDLRSGQGEVIVPVQNPDPFTACVILGMRVDPRTNYLFAAGCFNGNAFVYDADTGALIMEYQLNNSGEFGIVNDLTITNDAVYFTDSFRPVLYRLPLSNNGGIPGDPGAATELPLPPEFLNTDPFCCAGNGIVSTPNGKTLIIGHSNLARLYRLDTATGDVNEIVVDGPLSGFLDGIAMQGSTLYIMTPYDFPGPPVSIDRIQVVELDKGYGSGRLVETITDPDNLDGVASGAIFGSDLYVNNARYATFPDPGTPYWLTKLRIRPGK